MNIRAVRAIFRHMVDLLSFLFWALVLFGFNAPSVAILTAICAVIHESGHIAALAATGNFSGLPRFALSGFRIMAPRGMNYRDELITLAGGPAANLLAAIPLFILSLFFGEYFKVFAILNVFTALSNLLPVGGYDGYKLIYTVICMKEGGARAYKILEWTSFAFVALMTFISLYIILKVGEGYWIFAIFFVSLMLSLFKPKSKQKTRF